jgi:hypothetical protein
MTMRRRLISIPVLAVIVAGCQGEKPQAVPAPVVPPRPGTQSYGGSAQYGITFAYPVGWKPVEAGRSVFKVAAPAGSETLSRDYQKLNALQATFATASRADGPYQDDMKKNWCADATPVADAPLSVPDADARKIALAGHKSGQAIQSTAAMIIRKGQVYVITVESNPADAAAASEVFDQAVGSIRWTK